MPLNRLRDPSNSLALGNNRGDTEICKASDDRIGLKIERPVVMPVVTLSAGLEAESSAGGGGVGGSIVGVDASVSWARFATYEIRGEPRNPISLRGDVPTFNP